MQMEKRIKKKVIPYFELYEMLFKGIKSNIVREDLEKVVIQFIQQIYSFLTLHCLL